MKKIILPLAIAVIFVSALIFFRISPGGEDGKFSDFTSSISDDQTESATSSAVPTACFT